MAKILIVEDDPASRDYLRTLLIAGHHTVSEASDGEEALKLVHINHPDLVIADILMPTMDGFELVRQLRKDPTLEGTRVVLCSAAYLQRETEALAKSCGVTHIMVKPAEPQEVNRVIQETLQEPSANGSLVDEDFHRRHAGVVTDIAVRKSGELRIANERLSALIIVGNQLASVHDTRDLLDKFCKGARSVLAGRYSVVVLLDGENMNFAATSGLPAEIVLWQAFQSLALAVRKGLDPPRNTVRVTDEAALAMFETTPGLERVSGCLGSAIASRGKFYGFLLVAGKVGSRNFTDEDEQVAGTLGAQAAVSYENVLRVDKLRHEIAQRKQAEESLRMSEARNCDLIENAVHGVYRSSSERRFLEVNGALIRMLGYQSAAEVLALDLGTDVYRYAAERAPLVDLLETAGQVKGAEVQWKKKNGDLILVRLSGRSISGRPGEFEIIAEDTTKLRALEKSNHQLQKFEAIGQLAGGIAHDFNNVIGAILGWTELGLPEAVPGTRLFSYLEKIRGQTERAAGLTRQLLAFARRQILEPRNINLNQLTSETLGLLNSLIGENIEIKTLFASPSGMCRADSSQLEQVVTNLCLNARDAMPQGGQLLIETSDVSFDKEYCRRYTYARPGLYVLLSISDTGQGMDNTTMDQIFEPFFTTKEMGKGTGLGLATVYGIVKQHGGFIQVYSEIRKGSTFRVYLPRAVGEVESKKAKTQLAPVPRGTETILVAEDHTGNREIAKEVLERLGYRVLCANDGEAAVKLFEANAEQIALVLLDIIMPKLQGPDVLERIRARKPGVPALLTTGYSTELMRLESLSRQGNEILQKPYSPASLGQKVREALDDAASKVVGTPQQKTRTIE
jgi:two-component system cell cycle sensor histidine kinase/response regulator CckA